MWRYAQVDFDRKEVLVIKLFSNYRVLLQTKTPHYTQNAFAELIIKPTLITSANSYLLVCEPIHAW